MNVGKSTDLNEVFYLIIEKCEIKKGYFIKEFIRLLSIGVCRWNKLRHHYAWTHCWNLSNILSAYSSVTKYVLAEDLNQVIYIKIPFSTNFLRSSKFIVILNCKILQYCLHVYSFSVVWFFIILKTDDTYKGFNT